MPTINRQSAPDLALIAILTLFASAGLLVPIISAYYAIDSQNPIQTASAIGIKALWIQAHPFPTQAAVLTLIIFDITVSLLAGSLRHHSLQCSGYAQNSQRVADQRPPRLPKLLAGISSCEWAVWFNAHHPGWTRRPLRLRPSPLAHRPRPRPHGRDFHVVAFR